MTEYKQSPSFTSSFYTNSKMLKATLVLLIASLPSIVLATGAVILALNGIGIWGWFFAFSILTNPAIIGIKITIPE